MVKTYLNKRTIKEEEEEEEEEDDDDDEYRLAT